MGTRWVVAHPALCRMRSHTAVRAEWPGAAAITQFSTCGQVGRWMVGTSRECASGCKRAAPIATASREYTRKREEAAPRRRPRCARARLSLAGVVARERLPSRREIVLPAHNLRAAG